MRYGRNLASSMFDIFNYTFMTLFALAALIPFIHIVSVSFASPVEAITKRFLLVPTQFSLATYKTLLGKESVKNALLMSGLITVCGVALSLLFCTLMAYPLSIRSLKGRKVIMLLVVFTMLFRAGIIPQYMVVMQLGLINNLMSVLLPTSVNAFYLIIMINFFKEIPEEMRESARVDGGNELRILISIVLPLSKPILASLGLFFAVAYWNNFISPMLYLNNPKLWPVQIILRQIVLLSEGISEVSDPELIEPPAKTIKMGIIVIGTLPILCVYPFLQKHFAKGVMLGSIKG